MQFSPEVLDAMVGGLKVIGPATLRIHGTGGLLLELVLPTPWLTAPYGGAVHKAGAWEGVGLTNGKATWFEIVGPGGRLEGKVGADLEINNPNITPGRRLVITKFSVQLHT